MDPRSLEVPLAKLRWQCDPKNFTFRRTDELTPLTEFIGQDRAIRSISFGLAVDRPGYNIFVTGISGTGKASVVKAHLQSLLRLPKTSSEKAPPSDWVYLFNFVDADKPTLLKVPAGTGRQLKQSLERLRDEVQRDAVKAFNNDDYANKRKAIEGGAGAAEQGIFGQLETDARAAGFTVQFSQEGVTLLPLVGNRPATADEIAQMPAAALHDLEGRRAKIMARVEQAVGAARQADLSSREQLAELERKTAEETVHASFESTRRANAKSSEVSAFLERLESFTIERLDVLLDSGAVPTAGGPTDVVRAEHRREAFLPYAVNLFVDNSDTKSAPLIEEGNPTFGNLFGRVERRFSMGAYVTDHTLLKAGSMHRANNGYLILDMHLINQPVVWETLKRVIKAREVRPEDPAEQGPVPVPQGLKPEPMPIDLKLIIIGDVNVYNYLAANDEDFWETFKVKADFDYQIRRTPENLHAYGEFVCSEAHKHRLLPFDASGVAKVAEYAARAVDDQERLSTRFGLITDLLIESDQWARSDSAHPEAVEGQHVKKAIEEKTYRGNLIEERMREIISDGTIMVDVQGKAVGQINGLAVISFGDVSFGRPARITARTYLGRGGVINIEREAQMSGKTHDKGVLIIGGYLGWKYAQQAPLSVSASIAFEQSYSGIDGDSASSTEVYAILSSLADLPVRQDFAVTGSVNQKGEVQAIGGVNEKIEGFFDVCQVIGMTGTQGVLIPRTNVRNLMLREDILEAVNAGKFHVYSISSIDEGIELLTGVPAGVRGKTGKYPKGSVNFLVDKRLREYTESLRAAYRRPGDTPDPLQPSGVGPASGDAPDGSQGPGGRRARFRILDASNAHRDSGS